MKTFKNALDKRKIKPETDFDKISKETNDEKQLRNFREIRSLVYRNWLEQESKLNKIKRNDQLDIVDSIAFSSVCDLEEKYRRNLEVLDEHIEGLIQKVFKNKPDSDALSRILFDKV